MGTGFSINRNVIRMIALDRIIKLANRHRNYMVPPLEASTQRGIFSTRLTIANRAITKFDIISQFVFIYS